MTNIYGKLLNGKLIYAPTDYALPEGGIIKNFTSYPTLMMAYGYKLIIDNPPQFDATTSYLVIDSYSISETESKITVNYTIKSLSDKVPPTTEEEIVTLKSTDQMLTDCILELSQVVYSQDSSLAPSSTDVNGGV